MTDAQLADIVRAHTEPGRAPLVPGIELRLARNSHGIFQAIERLALPIAERLPPYWAFAWPGGQALARFILDNPHLVAGRRVVDIGAGSGLASIAAVMAGAASVLAVDIDPLAAAAIGINARANGAGDRIAISTRDHLDRLPDADLVIISDLVYEPELAIRVAAFLELAAAARLDVLIGDRGTARHAAQGLVELQRYAAPLLPALDDDAAEEGRVWQPGARRPRATGP